MPAPDDPAVIVARIHGCDWGRTIAQLRDSALCPARATRRLWRRTATGKRMFQLCDAHYLLATGQPPPTVPDFDKLRTDAINAGRDVADLSARRTVMRLQDRPAVRLFGLFVVAMHRGGIEIERLRVEGIALGLTATEAAETVGVWIRWFYQQPGPLRLDCIRQALQARADHTDWKPPHA